MVHSGNVLRVPLKDWELGRGWRGMEYIIIRKLKRSKNHKYSMRVVYKGFSGYTTTILRTKRFKTFREVLEEIENWYNLKVVIPQFLKHAEGELWESERKEAEELLKVM